MRIIVPPGTDVSLLAQSVIEARRRVVAAVPFRTVIYLEPRTTPDVDTDADPKGTAIG